MLFKSRTQGLCGIRRIAFAVLVLTLLLLLTGTALAEGSKTVYFSLSTDGVPVVGNDSNQTVLARVKVTVPYFDIALYGLENYYRYGSASFEEGGGYDSDQVVEEPTVLHLYLYMLEKYYMGLSESECLQGGLSKDESLSYYDRNGKLWNENGDHQALYLTGGATSMYMQQFWGHDENLMYYVNHQYPLQAAGWGSTADYILLEDGMDISVSMFTDWSFWNDGGAFTFFDKDEYTLVAGDTLTFSTLKSLTSAAEDGSSFEAEPISGLEVSLYNEDRTEKIRGGIDPKEPESNVYTYTFDEPGVYILMGEDPNQGTADARFTPAIAQVTVLENSIPLAGAALSCNLGHSGACADYPHALAFGEPLQFYVTLTPDNASGVETVWTSSNPEVFAVSDIGVVKTYVPAAGQSDEAIITVTVKQGETQFTLNAPVSVKVRIPVESISLDRSEATLSLNEVLQLTATVLPDDASNQGVTWSTSNSTVAHVGSNTGLVTALSAGTAVITATSNDNNELIASCTITVSEGVKGDVNGDGKITVTDVTKLIAGIRGKIATSDAMDINGDRKITVTDATKLIGAIRGKVTLS